MGWRIGVDIGGTFTDVAVLDEASGGAGIAKVSTTPRDFGAAVIEGVRAALEGYGIAPDAVSLLSHATTIVTNALLESKGANVALVTTRGFRDVLELRRSARADLYDLFQDAPAVLVPRRRRFEVTERIDAQGEVVTPLEEAGIDALIDAIRGLGEGGEGEEKGRPDTRGRSRSDPRRQAPGGNVSPDPDRGEGGSRRPGGAEGKVEAVAVCLMFSFLNDAHEQRIGARLRAALPGVPVFLSSEVLPEIREFERTSTTAVCAYVGPVLTSYLERLEAALAGLGLPALHVMGSNGGVLDVAGALRMPAAAVESGPAAGVIAAQRLGDQIGRTHLISFDMGGTTAKASLIEDGRIETTSEYEVGGHGNVGRWLHGTGHPVRTPVIDLAEVSAGGGSIAWIDPGGALRVGPASAGAEPGPACYGRGGDRPTVTDANVALGYLSPTHLLGGRLAVDAAASRAAIRTHVADPLGQDVRTAAAGIVSVVNHGMAEALRIVSVERGHDPRDFCLVAFGGAGPVHAAALAEALDVPEVVVPPIPGGFSALGLVATDLRRDWSHTFYSPIDSVDLAALDRRLGEMERTARAMLRNAAIPEEARTIERSADCRYTRQAYELTVPLAGGPVTRETLRALAREFHARHRRTYGHESPDEPVQIVNVRVTATGRMPRVGFHAAAPPTGAAGGTEPAAGAAPSPDRTAPSRGRTAAEGADDAGERMREAWFGEPMPCPVIHRHDLAATPCDGRADAAAGGRGGAAGGGRPGPLIVEEMDCTVVVAPGWRAALDERGFILMTRDAAC